MEGRRIRKPRKSQLAENYPAPANNDPMTAAYNLHRQLFSLFDLSGAWSVCYVHPTPPPKNGAFLEPPLMKLTTNQQDVKITNYRNSDKRGRFLPCFGHDSWRKSQI